MQQVVQNLRNGKLAVMSVPDPLVRPGHVLIANACSVISAGTEKMALELARKSLLGKARERPDHVRRVLEKLRQEGLFSTIEQVTAKLDEPAPLGYASAGTVLACGAGVQEFKPGDRVASNGPHAGVVCVPRNLCARVPDGVPFDQAAFGILGSIGLQGVRLARVELGATALVIGLGLIGQITVALLAAQGCRVIGTDPDPARCDLARRMGAAAASPGLAAADILGATRGLGADAVLITASTRSNDPIHLASQAVRKKGRIVLVGVVGLELDRREFYFKEAEFVVSCSYGPGRYDPGYEERGNDYPAGFVRWTEQRNLQAVLDLMAAGRLDVSPLVSHRFSIEKAEEAYDLIEKNREPYLGIVIEYPAPAAPARRLELRARAEPGRIPYALIGAGNFARSIMLPSLATVDALEPLILCDAAGLPAAHGGRKHGFSVATTDENDVFAAPEVRAVFIATRHNQHAGQVLRALAAGKSVFVEKPLCLTAEELEQIESALRTQGSDGSPALLMVGYNRRFSPAAAQVKEFFADTDQPLTVAIRFNAGDIPSDHWTQNELEGGGRIIGEACHAIDLASFLVGAPPVRVFAESVGGPDAKAVTDDQCFLTLRHADGSVSSIAYLSGGDRAFAKERVEVFGAGRVAVIDDFREVTTVSGGRTRNHRLTRQDKGHRNELSAFAGVLSRGGPAPIPWEDLKAVSLASFLAVRSLREGMPFDLR